MSTTRVNSITDAAGTGSPSFPNGLRVATIVGATGANDATINGDVPATGRGQIAFFAVSTPPTGWLKANGALVSRATYAGLFSVIGTTYGNGDGSTTFALPDLRGEFLRAWDDGRGVDSGRVFGTAQAHQLESHSHTIPVGGELNPGSFLQTNPNFRSQSPLPATGTTGPSGSFGTETRPRNIAFLACIKF